MIFNFSKNYPPDNIELTLNDVASAYKLIEEKDSAIARTLAYCVRQLSLNEDANLYLDAAVLATTRLALRHGQLSNDFHAYHNEQHVFDIANGRIPKLINALGRRAMPAEDWALLILFAAGHDIRLRETKNHDGPGGADEAASAAEMQRIMQSVGFEPDKHRAQFIAIEIAIIGSTFEPGTLATKTAKKTEPLRIGAFAKETGVWLDRNMTDWRQDHALIRAERLARLCADIDTANVADTYVDFAANAVNLCREREYRTGRDLNSLQSAEACYQFLNDGQTRFFFEAHRFSSREGKQVFGPAKTENIDRVRSHVSLLTQAYEQSQPQTGEAVMQLFLQLASKAANN